MHSIGFSKEVGFERNRIHGTNIIICTPGRLLQHMDQNPLLDPTNLKILGEYMITIMMKIVSLTFSLVTIHRCSLNRVICVDVFLNIRQDLATYKKKVLV